MSDRTARTGHGRWAAILTPCPGVLWCSDTGSVGFEPVPSGDVDPTPVLDMLANLDGPEAFDLIASLIGKDIKAGNLDTWTPDRNRRPNLGDPPTMTSAAEVMEALR